MINLFFIGIIIIVYCLFRQKHLIRIEWDKVAQFSAFLLLLSSVRFALMENQPTPIGYMPSFGMIPLVPWEDAFFSILGVYFFKDFLKLRKKFWIPIAIAFSVLFASGHVIYGLPWATMTLFFPYFLSYRYGKKYGYGTAMACHVLYDFTTILTVKLVILFNIVNRM